MTIQPCFIIPFTVLCQKCMLASCKADKKNITISLTYSYLFSTLQFVVYKTLPTININYLCLKICFNYKLWIPSCQYLKDAHKQQVSRNIYHAGNSYKQKRQISVSNAS